MPANVAYAKYFQKLHMKYDEQDRIERERGRGIRREAEAEEEADEQSVA